MGIIALGIIFFEIPETKDRSFEELDEMFSSGVGTRAFRNHQCSMDEPLRKLGQEGSLKDR
jgi:hypothetical protein